MPGTIIAAEFLPFTFGLPMLISLMLTIYLTYDLHLKKSMLSLSESCDLSSVTVTLLMYL